MGTLGKPYMKTEHDANSIHTAVNKLKTEVLSVK
jgi:hypothetical protein